jgi:signal transduction histidine kinase
VWNSATNLLTRIRLEAHNQATGKPERASLARLVQSMNANFSPVATLAPEAVLRRLDLTPSQIEDSKTRVLEDLAHELRQPLGVIESLAYFLELTSGNEQLCSHAQQIQAMVSQANSILERYCRTNA